MSEVWRAFTVQDEPLDVEANDPHALAQMVFDERPELDTLKLGRFDETAFCYLAWREVSRGEVDN